MNLNFGKIISILLFSTIIGLLINYFSPEGISLMREEKELTWADSDEIENNIENSESITVKEPAAVNLEQAYKLYQNNALFLDARNQMDFLNAHIKGAINLPYDSFDEFKNILNNISNDEPVVTYCGGDDCDLSIMLGEELHKMGYKKVYIFFGGWNEWLKAGYPVEKLEF